MWWATEQIEALKTRFRALDAVNLEKDAASLECIVWLIGWLQDRPSITESEYRTELARVQRDGVVWGAIRFDHGDPQ